jgi:hypothetical protein
MDPQDRATLLEDIYTAIFLNAIDERVGRAVARCLEASVPSKEETLRAAGIACLKEIEALRDAYQRVTGTDPPSIGKRLRAS